jgi:nicotinamidase-related amidase
MPKSILLIVDMLTDYDFPGADSLRRGAPEVVERINACREAATEAGVPVVFANDIDEQFSGSRELLFEQMANGPHGELVRPLKPADEDSFIHKGRHSAFYGTPLADLLYEWEVEKVVLAGQVTEQCIIYTGFDAHVRHYEIEVLTDCVLSIDAELGDAALRMMKENMSAALTASEDWTG